MSYHLMRCRMSCGYMSWSTRKLKKSSINHRSRKMTHQLFVINWRQKFKLRVSICLSSATRNSGPVNNPKFNILYHLVSFHFSINYFSPMNYTDEADAGISNLLFAVNNKERPPWRCCSNSTLPSSEVIFFVQVNIIV